MKRKRESSGQGLFSRRISRREFIRSAAVGAAGLGAGTLSFAPFTYGEARPIKIGMLQE